MRGKTYMAYPEPYLIHSPWKGRRHDTCLECRHFRNNIATGSLRVGECKPWGVMNGLQVCSDFLKMTTLDEILFREDFLENSR